MNFVRRKDRINSFNFPNNPTGAVLEKNRFQELVSLCRDNGIYLFSDEVYRSDLLGTPQDRFRIGFGRNNIEEGLSVFRRYLLETSTP